MKKTILITSLFTLGLLACNSPEKKENIANLGKLVLNKVAIKTLTTNCYTCHNPVNQGSYKIAPTMAEIRTKYLEEYKSKEEFVAMFSGFVENPTSEKSVLTDAVEKYGIMPNLSFSEKKTNEIALYLFDNNVDTKEWLAENITNREELPYEAGNYIEKGMYFVMQTKPELGKRLMKQIKTKGTASAVGFCNLNALKIVDSMENVLDAKIKRVTDKPRNSNNQANKEELSFIKMYNGNIKNKKKPKPFIQEVGNKMNFYAPILTNGMCLQCHGNEKNDIKFEVKSILDSLYPNDKAKGYLPNQIRGIWKVEFEK